MFWIIEKIRFGIGETNSSSTHTYYLGKTTDKEKVEKIREKLTKFLKQRDGKLVIFPEAETEFGWEVATYTWWKDLWNWLVIGYYSEKEFETRKEDYVSEYVKKFERLVEDFTGVKVEPATNNFTEWKEVIEKAYLGNYSYIDHASAHLPAAAVEDVTDLGLSLAEILTGTLYTSSDG